MSKARRTAAAPKSEPVVAQRPGSWPRFLWRSLQLVVMVACAALFFGIGEHGRPILAAAGAVVAAGVLIAMVYRTAGPAEIRIDPATRRVAIAEHWLHGRVDRREAGFDDVADIAVDKRTDFERLRVFEVNLRLKDETAVRIGTFRREADAVGEATRLLGALGRLVPAEDGTA